MVKLLARKGIIEQSRQTVSRPRINQVAAMVGLTNKEMATLLGVSERHLYNKSERPLSVVQSEHLLYLEQLFEHGLTIFDGNKLLLAQWLRTPKSELAVPETGFLPLDKDYKQPSLTELFPEDQPSIGEVYRQNVAIRQRITEPLRTDYPTPLSLLDTLTGVALVEGILGRIDAGVFS